MIKFSDDDWNQNAANVVCRMLGFIAGGQATSNSYFGQVTTDFGMDDVLCQGTESDILDCPHITTHNCGPSEGAGVICNTCESRSLAQTRIIYRLCYSFFWSGSQTILAIQI